MYRCCVLLLSCALTACGMKGPLYLPDRAAKPTVVTPAPTETKPAPLPAEPSPGTEQGDEDAKAKQSR